LPQDQAADGPGADAELAMLSKLASGAEHILRKILENMQKYLVWKVVRSGKW